jgi:hypothetical protein
MRGNQSGELAEIAASPERGIEATPEARIRGLVMIVQSCVHNGADTRLRRFYYDVLGKSQKRFLLQLEGEHGKHKET